MAQTRMMVWLLVLCPILFSSCLVRGEDVNLEDLDLVEFLAKFNVELLAAEGIYHIDPILSILNNLNDLLLKSDAGGLIPARVKELENYPDFRETIDCLQFGGINELNALYKDINFHPQGKFFIPPTDLNPRPDDVLQIEKNKLGRQKSSPVYRASWKWSSVAVKKLKRATKATDAPMDTQAQDEDNLLFLHAIRHPNIVRIYGASSTLDYVVMELCDYSLTDYLQDSSIQIPWSKRLSILLDIANGLLYLHTLPTPVAHGDLRSFNVMISTERAKLTDLVHMVQLGNPSFSYDERAVMWQAPEQLGHPVKSANLSSDIYSFGIVMFEVLIRDVPYEELSHYRDVPQLVLDGRRPEAPTELNSPGGYRRLMESCWQQNPEDRPTIQSVITKLESMLETYASFT